MNDDTTNGPAKTPSEWACERWKLDPNLLLPTDHGSYDRGSNRAALCDRLDKALSIALDAPMALIGIASGREHIIHPSKKQIAGLNHYQAMTATSTSRTIR